MALQIILYLLSALLVLAACQDVMKLTIANVFPTLVVLLFPAWVAVAGPEADIWMNGVNFLIILGVGLALFAMQWLGGGDVKLFAAVALWFDFAGIVPLIFYVTATGAALTIILALVRRTVPAGVRSRLDWAIFERRGPIPYGVAIAMGAILCIFLQGVNPSGKVKMPSYIAAGPSLHVE
ncbi:A24 family peptidase [Rhizorhapis suberifaciens]|uniref:Prepilin peptidase CpaA n=1 Tax=Rhizorhapis suberifaciens TaxID=13656 RepID=A0A840HUF6_9SPHN|nr:prepilin peptidase [Rhizorhapis suberifaciens]MBB4641220.1 prepilin peptidase CpaA [Rhizorhapis suberifaciens]